MKFYEFFTSLFFILIGIYYRFEFGVVSFALIEPFAIVFIIVSVIYFLTKGKFIISTSWFFRIWFLFVILLAIILPLSPDLKRSLSDIRDWMIPLLVSIFVFSFKNLRWEKILTIFIICSLLFAGVGLYQHFTKSFYPFATERAMMKSGFTIDEQRKPEIVCSAIAFFPHPNQFANYLLCSFIIGLGFLAQSRKKLRWIIILSIVTGALILTYSKASIALLPIGIVIFLFLYRSSSIEDLVLLISTIGIIIVFLYLLIFINLPETVFTNLFVRYKLFKTVLEIILENPLIFIMGNGARLYSLRAFYPNPHNLYFYFLLNYGIAGLTLLLFAFFKTIVSILKTFRMGITKINPLLGGIFTSLIMGFFILGLTEVPLQDINLRTLFFLLFVAFLGIYKSTEEKICN